jgi:hypothetical protein
MCKQGTSRSVRGCQGDQRSLSNGSMPVPSHVSPVTPVPSHAVTMGKAGRLRMGPLYVLSDVYCTGGEALIRNLLLGAAQADAFHARQQVVYLPDTFGLTPEVPMLAAGFGYDCVVFMRGLPQAYDQRRRFWHWQAADGSRCMVYRLRDGYASAAQSLDQGTQRTRGRQDSASDHLRIDNRIPEAFPPGPPIDITDPGSVRGHAESVNRIHRLTQLPFG